MRIEDLPEKWQKEVRGRIAVYNADMERIAGNAPLAKKEDPQPYTPGHDRCSVRIHSVRKQLADIDGISGKYALDAIVRAGIITDDSPEYVKSVTHTQEKGFPESTTITVEWE